MSVYCDKEWIIASLAAEILKYDACSEKYLSLLDIDVEGFVKKFNELNEGFEDLLFDEKMEWFANKPKFL